MPEELVGSVRVRVEPDFTGFDTTLVSEATAAADAASSAIAARFAETSGEISSSLGSISTEGFDSIESGAVEAAAGVSTSMAGAASSIESEMAGAATEADAALSGIGEGAADEISSSFTGVGDTIAAEVEAGTSSAAGALDDLGSTSEEVAAIAGDAWESASKKIVGALAAVGITSALGGLLDGAERIVSIAGATQQLIQTTGGAANVTAADVVELGDSLERLTGIDSELAQEAQNILLTFKNVRNEVGAGNDIFTRAVAAGADLSAVLGGDLTGSVLQLGKALQDPTRGVNALRRAGVDFTIEQREMIRGFVESNDLLAAQNIILDEVESQVGGVAEASARASDIIATQFGNLGEQVGLGLVPAVDELADQAPRITEALLPIADDVGEALGTVVGAGTDAFIELIPVLGTTTELLLVLTPVLDVAVDLLELVPTPVLQGAAALLTFNKAVGLVNASRVPALFGSIATSVSNMLVPVGSVSGAFNGTVTSSQSLGTSLRGLTSGVAGASLAFGAGFAALSLWKGAMADAEQSGREFGNRVRSQFDLASLSTEELAELANNLGTQIEGLQEETDTGIIGRVVNADFNAEVAAAAEELFAFREEVVATREEALRLQAEADFGGIADGLIGRSENLGVLVDESAAASAAVQQLLLRGTEADGVFIDLAGTLDEAALSEEGMAAAAALLGTDVESLQGFIEGVTGALSTFVDTAVSQLPTLSQAFRDTNEDNRVTAGEFITGLEEDTARIVGFMSNLETLVAAGFTDIAAELALQGSTVAGVTAEQLATAAEQGNTALLERTRTGLQEREAAIAASTDFFATTLGPAFVTASGVVGDAARAAFGEGFDPAEQTRIAMGLASTTLTGEGLRVAAIAAVEGEDAAREFGEGLNLDDTVIAQAIAAGNALRENDEIVNAAIAAGTGVGSAFAIGTANGMRIELQEVRNAAGEIVFSAADAAALAGRIRSPSRLFAEQIGQPISEGIAVGIAEGASLVDAAVSDTITDAANQRPLVDFTARAGSVAAGRTLPDIDVGGEVGVVAGRGVTIERLVLPTSEPEMAAATIINGLVDIEVGIGSS